MRTRSTNCVALGVGSMEAARDHYAEHLGWKAVKETSDWIELESGDLRIFLCQDDVMTPVFDMNVRDVDEARARLELAGWVVAPFSDKELFMTDPFGYTWCVSPDG